MKTVIYRLLQDNKNFSLKAEGNSMLPLLRSGDILYLRKIKFQQIKINDLVMAKNGKIILTHRVIYKNNSGSSLGSDLKGVKGLTPFLVTKGDNNSQSDGKMRPNQIMGKVYQIKRNKQIINLENFYLLQSTLYFQEIVKVKNAFERGKINFVFLKGLPLHLYFEKTHPRRVYADCDVLIDQSDYTKVKRVFKRFGYSASESAYSPIHKLLKNKKTEVSFVKSRSGLKGSQGLTPSAFPVVFDIHFDPVFLMNQLGRLDALYSEMLMRKMTREFLWTKRKIKVQNESFFILDTPYLILYLALHFFHHNYRGIFRLELIDKIIRKGKNRDEILKQVQDDILKYQVQNFVYPVFILLKKYYQTPIPIEFIKSLKIKSGMSQYIQKNILKSNIFDDETRLQAGINRFKNIFFLSQEPIYKKIFVFVTPSVVYSVLWSLSIRIKSIGLKLRHINRS